VFALGVLILDLALLTPQSEVYTESQTINLPYLQQSLRGVQAKYGKEFVSIL